MKSSKPAQRHSMETPKSLTVILPVLNEVQNIQLLLSEFEALKLRGIHGKLQIIIVDDGSTDGIEDYLARRSVKNINLIYLRRTADKSLPLSIWEGIVCADSEYVVWMDADGSMPVKVISQLWEKYENSSADAVIGSRYVEGGGHKGINVTGKTSFYSLLKNVNQSEDMLIAVILSKILNIFLRFTVCAGILDMTSGFMLTRKELLERSDFDGIYGDYFPNLISKWRKRSLVMEELGYVCIPRQYGESKTGTNIIQLVKSGIPYLRVGIRELLQIR